MTRTPLVDHADPSRSIMHSWSGWLFPQLPEARVVLLRRCVYAFVVLDVLWLHHTGVYHGYADPGWYVPLKLGRLFHLPAANVPLAFGLMWGCVAGALLCLLERLPDGVRRVAGMLTAISWTWFQYVAFSYGKVDHDRGDFVIALLVLPLVAGAALNRAPGAYRRSEAAGFALRAVQLAAIATYFLSAWAKVRFGGWDWVNSATILRAVVRRGNWLSRRLVDFPFTLHWFQWVLFTLELLSPLIFLVALRWQYRMVFGWYLFHLVTYLMIGIAFWPHLVMMLAFLPLEQYRDTVLTTWRGARGG